MSLALIGLATVLMLKPGAKALEVAAKDPLLYVGEGQRAYA